ncbi:MAG TPA: hypothetical protein DCZ92_02300 [Elusimicrobia bacterium]|nr:MAG: hypothetical protein A2016_03480 [Elusimicrobia bacterium GWF2_62_30]HBA59657.1 hypothetical protein [Elusimicrobiota bacterium]
MPDENNSSDTGTQQPAPSVDELKLQDELKKVRSGNKWLKVVVIGFSSVLAVIFIFAYLAYRRIMQAKEVLDSFSQSAGPVSSGPASEGRGVTAPLRVDVSSEAASGSGLALISMPGGGEEEQAGGEQAASGSAAAAAKGMDPAKAKRIMAAMTKYSDRPIMRDFLAELDKDPVYAKARAQQKNGNPMAMISAVQKSPAMKGLITKYAKRPDFMPFMMELMRDPELRPFMGGGLGGADVPPSVPSPRVSAPAPARAAAKPAADENSDADGDGEMTFNAAAVSGTSQPAPARKSAVKAPPPIDSGR